MDIIITARHFKAPDKLKKFIENEITKLDRFYDRIIDCEVVLDYIKASNSIQSVEIRLKASRSNLTATAKSDDMYKSVDMAVKKLERQLKKLKGRIKSYPHTKAVAQVMSDNYFEEE